MDIDNCETNPVQAFSTWKCEWLNSKQTKLCLKTCDENFQLDTGFTDLTCHVSSGWVMRKIAKCIPKTPNKCDSLEITSNRYISSFLLKTCLRCENCMQNVIWRIFFTIKLISFFISRQLSTTIYPNSESHKWTVTIDFKTNINELVFKIENGLKIMKSQRNDSKKRTLLDNNVTYWVFLNSYQSFLTIINTERQKLSSIKIFGQSLTKIDFQKSISVFFHEDVIVNPECLNWTTSTQVKIEESCESPEFEVSRGLELSTEFFAPKKSKRIDREQIPTSSEILKKEKQTFGDGESYTAWVIQIKQIGQMQNWLKNLKSNFKRTKIIPEFRFFIWPIYYKIIFQKFMIQFELLHRSNWSFFQNLKNFLV